MPVFLLEWRYFYFQSITEHMKKLILFVVFAVALFAFQAKVVLPTVSDIVASDLFLKDTGDERNDLSSTSLMTMSAFDQCNNYIANELLPDSTIVFADSFANAFGLGDHQYVLNADLEIQPEDGPVYSKRYVCKIRYSEGTDISGINVTDNWSVVGMSGLENL